MPTHQNKVTTHLEYKLKKLSGRFYLYMAVFWTILTLYLSLISARAASKFNVWDIIGFDKLAHMIFYTVFSFLWSMSFRSIDQIEKKILFFSISFGVLMEICQLYLFNGRSFELYDILANIIGSIMGVILFKKFIN
jgi:VanZ family protein